MSDEMEEIISEFITEAEESLDKIEPLFVELEQKGEDADLLNEIFRSMHTIKGAAGFLGFQPIVDVAHSSENIMKRLRDREFSLSRELMDVILKSIDMLRILLGHLKDKDGVEEDVSSLVSELESALRNAINGSSKTGEISEETDRQTEENSHKETSSAESVETNAGGVEPKPAASSTDSTADPPVDQPVSDATPHPDTDASAVPEQAAASAQNSGETHVADDAQKLQQHGQKLKEKLSQNLRVDVERIDKVMDLAGEVVLVRNRLLNISGYFEHQKVNDPQLESLVETVSFLDRVTSDLQLAVMKMRMQPIKKVLSKFPRFVRDMSATVRKNVDLQIFGENTEVDKTVIENIGDPLTHILRNSIDHGIESAEERTEKGKSPRGKIVINVYQKGNQIVIEISDDGRGIDVEALKAKAIEKGLITPDDAARMADDAATDIIFMPGFSTKEVATELSGRGVGMDVVKTNISQLNGYVEIKTEKDVGTTFRICIPLTLAIIQALMVEVGGAKYAIPLSPIEETLQITPDQIDNVSGESMIVIRDKVCPLFELNKILDTGSNGSNGSGDNTNKYLIVISIGDKKFCLAVDQLLGQEEVVIKNLEGVDTSSSYVLGATITGDGKVVFIIDVTALSRSLVAMAKG
jgi:two-component system chemotaxis sensor kinase CheA